MSTLSLLSSFFLPAQLRRRALLLRDKSANAPRSGSLKKSLVHNLKSQIDISYSRHQNLFSPKKSIAPTLSNSDNSTALTALPTPDSPILPTNSVPNSAETFSLSVTSNLEPTIISAREVDYSKLRDFLSKKKWKSADRETWGLMCQSLSQPPGTQLEISQIYQLPCEDFQTVDRLWLHYSQGRFGFSVQKQIYESVKGDYIRFCDRVIRF